MIRSIELRFEDQAGSARTLRLAGAARGECASIVLSSRTQPILAGEIVQVVVENRGAAAVRLGVISFELTTGFSTGSRAQFFKHGYQSWSPSYPAVVGLAGGEERRSLFSRISHQSEAERPPDAPEGATSELFTIVEDYSSAERFLAGFVEAAHQFSTVTVITPDLVTARVLFDRVWLGPGEVREAEPLAYWRSNQSTAEMAVCWAGLLGGRMGARVTAAYRRGWCSWYQYFHAVSEDALRSNLLKLKELRREFPVDVVQLDDGFQARLGDWDRTNSKFPSGLGRIAGEIREAGFVPGLWTAPFLASRDSNLMLEHADWFIRDGQDEPVRVAHNPNWTVDSDKFAYALDPTHPEFTRHLEGLFTRLVHEFGYGYLKLDFLFAGAADGIRHNSKVTRAEALRHGLETIRRAAGDDTFILGCGCPLGAAVGAVDGMRIGPDVAPYWGGEVEPGTRLALEAIIARSFMHRRLWRNDPDCLMLRGSDTQLSGEERYALAAAIAVSGGMLFLSDNMELLDSTSAQLFRMAAEVGAEVDNASGERPPLPTTFMDSSAVKSLKARTRWGTILLLLNTSDAAQIVSSSTVVPSHARGRVNGPGGETEIAELIELPAHCARIIRYRVA